MRILIAVISYSGDAQNGAHDVIRETWGGDVSAAGADLRFFIGHRNSEFCPKADEVLTERMKKQTCGHSWVEPVENCCVDYWQHLTREILRWSIQQQYDFTFLCCNDTFIIPSKLMASGFEKYDYSGKFVPRDIPLGTKSEDEIYGHHLYLWADAGVGWFTSKKAAKFIVDDKPDFWTNDIHIGQTLGPLIASGEVKAGNLSDFWNSTSWHYRILNDNKGYVESGVPDITWMRRMYQIYGNA